MCQMGVNEPPRSKPLLSVDELLSWTPESDEDNEFCRGLVPLPQVCPCSTGIILPAVKQHGHYDASNIFLYFSWRYTLSECNTA